MIITRTPFRVSFGGGGTDIKDFYHIEPGAITGTTIRKHMYITVNKRFDESIRVSYSKTEIVENVERIRHPLVREALKLVGITSGIEIVSIADIPSGTGLGSSSSFTVGLLNALHAYKGTLKSAEELASEACQIEIEILGEPIGKQDQYMAAYGGIHHIQFNPDDSVFVHPVMCSQAIKEELSNNLLLFYTGVSRDAGLILEEQKAEGSKKDKVAILREMRNLAVEIKECLIQEEIDEFGKLLHRGWMLKKRLASSITNEKIDAYYRRALSAGALGGKILGAGGGGFLLLYCPKEKQPKVREALNDLTLTEFSLEPEGSKIIYVI